MLTSSTANIINEADADMPPLESIQTSANVNNTNNNSTVSNRQEPSSINRIDPLPPLHLIHIAQALVEKSKNALSNTKLKSDELKTICAAAEFLLKNPETAPEGIKLLDVAAEANSSSALLLLGNYYFSIRNKNPENAKKAFETFAQGAKVNIKEAGFYHNLGICYFLGVGTPQSDQSAYDNFSKAVKISPNHSASLYREGYCLLFGRGVKLQKSEGFKKCLQATELDPNNYKGLTTVGACYLYGNGTKKSVVKALNYFEKAVAKNPNYVEVLRYLHECYKYGFGTKPNTICADHYKSRIDALTRSSITNPQQRSHFVTVANNNNNNNNNINAILPVQTNLLHLPEANRPRLFYKPSLPVAALNATDLTQTIASRDEMEKKRLKHKMETIDPSNNNNNNTESDSSNKKSKL